MKQIIILCFFAAMILTVSADSQIRKVNYCNLDSFFTCFVVPLARFTHQTNGTGIPKDDPEFEELCT